MGVRGVVFLPKKIHIKGWFGGVVQKAYFWAISITEAIKPQKIKIFRKKIGN